ncbi:hypothetical protein [[Eubacterium] cellulosolvens]
MKSGIFAGTIAGVVMGIVASIVGYFLTGLRLIEPAGGFEIWNDPSMQILLVLAEISLGLIWGSIFGAIYSYTHNIIPGKGIIKGLYFGLIIWLIKDVAAGSYTALILTQIQTALLLIIYGFIMWIVYGPLLGYLYKK